MTSIVKQGLVAAMENYIDDAVFKQIKELIETLYNYEDEEFDIRLEQIANLMPDNLLSQLKQIVDGPVEDGDVSSKVMRDILIDLGLCTHICYKGETGYTGAYYLAAFIFTALDKD